MHTKNKNLTPKKLVYFIIANGLGAILFIGIQYPLLHYTNLHYAPVTFLAGAISMLLKFLLSGVFVFNECKN